MHSADIKRGIYYKGIGELIIKERSICRSNMSIYPRFYMKKWHSLDVKMGNSEKRKDAFIF